MTFHFKPPAAPQKSAILELMPQIDDVFVGAADKEYTDPWQSLLKAYASDFVNADTVKYSAVNDNRRIQRAAA